MNRIAARKVSAWVQAVLSCAVAVVSLGLIATTLSRKSSSDSSPSAREIALSAFPGWSAIDTVKESSGLMMFGLSLRHAWGSLFRRRSSPADHARAVPPRPPPERRRLTFPRNRVSD